MAVIDIQGNIVSLQSPGNPTNPNADLAWKAPVRAATTGSNITLSGQQTIDGVALSVGDRVLVKDQTDQTTNGLYNVQTGPWTRTIDANNNSQWSQGVQVMVSQGSINLNAAFVLTTANPIIVGTSNLVFTSPATLGNLVTRVISSPGSLTVGNFDSVILIEAAVTSISLPATKSGTVTIIDATGNFGGANCTVTASGGATISGMSSDVLAVNYLSRTYRQLANGNYVIQ